MSKKFKNLQLVTSIKKTALHKEVTKTVTIEQCQNRQGHELFHFGCRKPSAGWFHKTYKSLSTINVSVLYLCGHTTKLTELEKRWNNALRHMVSFLGLSCARPRVKL